jgi:hypothetical protein
LFSVLLKARHLFSLRAAWPLFGAAFLRKGDRLKKERNLAARDFVRRAFGDGPKPFLGNL